LSDLIPQEYYPQIFKALSEISGKEITSTFDLMELEPIEVLRICESVTDEFLPFFIKILKCLPDGDALFKALNSGTSIEELELSSSFFHRYQNILLEVEEADDNPLIWSLEKENWQDLVLMQSRETFFLRQTMEHIHEFLKVHFDEVPVWEVHEQKEAWNWFFNQIILA
jgi:hypothetical protein